MCCYATKELTEAFAKKLKNRSRIGWKVYIYNRENKKVHALVRETEVEVDKDGWIVSDAPVGYTGTRNFAATHFNISNGIHVFINKSEAERDLWSVNNEYVEDEIEDEIAILVEVRMYGSQLIGAGSNTAVFHKVKLETPFLTAVKDAEKEIKEREKNIDELKTKIDTLQSLIENSQNRVFKHNGVTIDNISYDFDEFDKYFYVELMDQYEDSFYDYSIENMDEFNCMIKDIECYSMKKLKKVM